MERRSTACLWLHGQWRLIFFSSVFFFLHHSPVFRWGRVEVLESGGDLLAG